MTLPSRLLSRNGCKLLAICALILPLFAAGCTSTASSSSGGETVGPPAKVAITTQPGSVAAGSSTLTVIASIEDANGNVVTTSNSVVTLAITTGTGANGAILSGTVQVTAVSGVATFSGLSINTSGAAYSLTASATGLTSATTTSFNVFGPATKLAFTTSPSVSNTGGTAWTQQPIVTVQDANGITVSNSTASVNLVITSGTGANGAQLTCTTNPLTATAGVATFAGCKINLASATTYTLTATATNLTNAVSSTFSIAAGAATQLIFSTSPNGGTGGTVWTTQPVVTAEDAGGNTATGSTASITLAITSGTGATGAAVTCNTNPLGATAGVATFAGCKINLASATTYSLTASATGLTSATSATFSIAVGAATQLKFTTSPSGGTGGTVWTTQPVVTVQDAGGNIVTSTASIMLAISSGTGAASAVLTCTTNPLAATAGVATFAACKINLASGTAYSLTATSAGLTSGTSATFNVTAGTATQLIFTTSPNGGTGGIVWTTQPIVTVEDAGGNAVTGSSASIALAITSGTGAASAVLTCTANTLAATAGVASFAGCKINLASGSTYTLTATSAGLTSGVSSTFSIAVGPASQLSFTPSPNGGTAGSAWTTQPVVTVEDAGGNTVNSALSIALSITSGTGTPSAQLTCTNNTISATAGVATFVGCQINLAGTGYTLTASATGVSSALSSTFSITAGPATQLLFTTGPQTTPQNTNMAAISVAVKDNQGNTVTTSTASIMLAITNGTGATGATLQCATNPLAATAGVASFTNCQINDTGSNYTLTATATGLTNAVSVAFNITITVGPASKLTFTTSPNGGTGGTAWTTQPVVAVQDASGNTVTTGTGSNASIALTITGGTGNASASLTCTSNTLTATAGVATFAGCKINLASGTTYTLTATSTGLTSGVSNTFSITVGAATQLTFSTSPNGGTGGTPWTTQPVVTVQDAGGNTVSSALSISLGITSGTGNANAVLACTTNPLGATAGVATFAGCKINLASGTTYTLTATSTGLTSGVSNTFSITVGAATQLTFTTSPNGGSGGTPWTTQPVVTVEDAGGNTVTGNTASINLAITGGTGAASAVLTCTTNPLGATAGVATFAACKINLASGNTYTLTATATGLTSAVSGTFSIAVGAASQLTFTTQPGGGEASITWLQQPVVAIQDAGGNTLTGSSAQITLSITSGTGATGALLSCTTNPLAATAGVASFAACQINDASTSTYTLTAASSGVPNVISQAFSVTSFGTATKLFFTVQPGGGTGGTPWTLQPVVLVQDASGKTVTNSTVSINLAITNGTGQSGASLGCSSDPLSASSGVATFAGCQINFASGTSYTLTASATGLTSATSNSFSIAVGSAVKLGFTTQPGNGTGGSVLSTQPVVAIQDAGGNTVTSSSASITLAVTPGSGSGVLVCSPNPVTTVSGVASFASCKINIADNGYTLTASATGFTSGISDTFNITVGAASRLLYQTQPSGAVAGAAFAFQPVVQVKDAGGDTISTSTASIALAITSGTGATGATLACTGGNSAAAVSGIATFAGCQINDASSTTYTITATSSGLTSVVSTAFTVETSVGPASKLAFTVQPNGVEAGGVAIGPAVQVTIEDIDGNPVTSATNQVSITSSVSGTLTGTTSANPSSGVATFSDLVISTAGTYTLTASATGLTSGVSAQFTVYNSLPANCNGAPSGNEYLMTGNWAGLMQGFSGTGTGYPVASVFAISTNGAGGLNNLDGNGMGGQTDRQNGSSGASSYINLTIEQSGSSYVIGQDPNGAGYVGCLTLANSNGGVQYYRVSLGGITGSGTAARASKARIILWGDISGTGNRIAGVMLPQDSTKFAISSMQPYYAAQLDGEESTAGGHYAIASSFNLNTSTGAITGVADLDDGLSGSGCLDTPITGSLASTSTTSITGRLTGSISASSCPGTSASGRVIYIVNANEAFIMNTDAYTNGFPIVSGRAIVTSHSNFTGSSLPGNYMIHMTGISTVSSGNGCTVNGVPVDCAEITLVAISVGSPSGQTATVNGYSWDYQYGQTVSPQSFTGVTATVDATWGRLSFSGGGTEGSPVFYLATPQANTEPYVGFGIGSGACTSGQPPCTSTALDPTASSGFMEVGASTNVAQTAIAGNYFFGTEDSADNYVGNGIGVSSVSTTGVITGTQYAQEGTSGLQVQSLAGSSLIVTNADPLVTTDTFPGLANTGVGSFGITNGTRFIFFDTGAAAYGQPGNSDAQFIVGDQQQ